MKLDFYHNKIVADTITAEFEHCFRNELVPILEAKHGIIPEIQMYEDYISDNFIHDGYWYYPLTLVTAGGEVTQWVRWPVNSSNYEDSIPYSFVGSGRVNFELAEPIQEFENKLLGRSRYSSGGRVKVRIETLGQDPTKLSGKYSQTFIDEMAKQLTVAIESATGVSGVADSSVELIMVFAPGTYMEHTSENRTYRRLMLIDKVSAPRDFWIQWTRLDGAVAYTVSSHVNSENILFELGEDVDQKIREKEYRYLLSSGKEKYHNSMGRRKVTEWRDVIKRAAKRGELVKIETDFELAPETVELEERIADLLGKRSAERGGYEKAEIPYITEENDDFVRAMEKARMIVEEANATVDEPVSFTELAEALSMESEIEYEDETASEAESEEVSENTEEEIFEESEEIDIFDDIQFDEPSDSEETDTFELEDFDEDDDSEEFVVESITPPEVEGDDRIVDIFEMIDGVLAEDIPDDDSDISLEGDSKIDLTEYPSSEVEDMVVPVIIEEPAVVESSQAKETVEEPVSAEPEVEEVPFADEPAEVIEEAAEEPVFSASHEQISFAEEIAEPVATSYYETPIADRAADIRAEIETKIRLEYESRARLKAEQEIVALRREQEKLRMEKESLEAAAKKEQERLLREYEMLRIQTKKAEQERAAREAQRRAEEIRLREQIEAQLRQEAMERERLAEAARMAIEEQHRLEAENARMARIREEEERREAEKLRREQEERELEALRQAEIERIRREDEEAKARARAAMPEMGDGRYSYTSKSVKFLFRKSVDPNITNRIYEIMKATVEYYGKDRVYLKIKATVPDSQTVVLDFEHIPIEEMELLGNIIKILGNSGLGIAKAIIE